MCASESYRSQYHTRVPNKSVSECTRAMHCPHASRNLRPLNLRILVSTRKRTLEYSQSYSQAFAMELISTREYSQSNSRVLAIIHVSVSHNCINKLWCTCGMAIRGKFLPGDALSLQMKNLREKKTEKELTTRLPVKFLAMLIETETSFSEA